MKFNDALLGAALAALGAVVLWHIQGFPRLLLLYRDLPEGIEVIRVLDAGRDIAALFDDAGISST